MVARSFPALVVRRALALLTGLLAAALVSMVFLGWQAALADQWVAQTIEAREVADGLLASVQDALSGQDGFLLTGDAGYLRPYERVEARIAAEEGRLHVLTATLPVQQARLHAVEPVVADTLEELRRTVAFARMGRLDAAKAEVRVGDDQRRMEQIRDCVSGIDQAVAELLAGRERAAARTRRLLLGVAALSLATAGGFAVLVLGTYRGDARVLRAERDALETAVRARTAELADSVARLRNVTDMARVGLVVMDKEHRYRFTNRAYGAIFDLGTSDIVGRHAADVLPTIYQSQIKPRLDCAFAGDRMSHELVVPWTEGERRFAVNYEPGTEPDGMPIVVVVIVEITERFWAAQALRESERRLTLAQDVGGIATWDWNVATGQVVWSSQLPALLGLPPSASAHVATFFDRVHPDDRGEVADRLNAAIREGGDYAIEFRVVRPDETVRWLAGRGLVERDAAGEVTRVIGVSYDITVRREAAAALERLNVDLERQVTERTAELVQLQKMESLGQLTGGVAHDFNNLLMAVMGSLELLRKRMADDPRGLRLIDTATRAAERGASLTTRLLAFARRQVLTPQAVDIGGLLTGMADLLARSLGPLVRLEFDIPSGLTRALVDPHQLELAILNLSVNARDAMPDGGRLRLAASEEVVTHRNGLMPGRYIVLTVSDTGEGMSESVLARASEPFFTTKGIGKGTGLGLSMVHGVAAQSGGLLALASKLGEGTTATLYLPLAEAPVALACEPAGPPPAVRPLAVLVVDDDHLVLEGVAALLEDLGHSAVLAGSGAAALDLLVSGTAVDVVVTDYAMPRMTGLVLAAAIARLRPGLPVVIASGYAELPDDGTTLPRLGKPFRQDELARALAAVADARSPVEPSPAE